MTITPLVGMSVLLVTSGALLGQSTAPGAGLIYLQSIPIPTWTTSGATQANFDIFAFNPQTRVMYMADRTNHSVTAIDTRTNGVIGILPVPGGPSTNGALIAADLQQLIVTDGRANVFVYDLRVPQSAPDTYVLPNVTGGTDALDYDPLNRTVYVINGSAPYFITGIDLAHKKVSTQLALPGSPELMKFNPVDGLIYQVISQANNPANGVIAYDPASNSIRAQYPTPDCVPHGIDIDPVTNTALLGCNQAQILMNLKDGSTLKSFPDVTGSDLLAYNPNNRRFYVGAGSNVSTTTGCPADTTKSFPVLGVFDVQGSTSAGVGRLVGVQCAGRNSHGLGIDPIQNFIYLGARQYPADPNDANTGQPGVLVFYDPAPPAQPLTTQTQATLSAVGGGRAQGAVSMTLVGRSISVVAKATGVSGATPLINITTSMGNEGVACGKDSDTTVLCTGSLLGDPIVGGSAMLAMDGSPVAQGAITAGKGN